MDFYASNYYPINFRHLLHSSSWALDHLIKESHYNIKSPQKMLSGGAYEKAEHSHLLQFVQMNKWEKAQILENVLSPIHPAGPLSKLQKSITNKDLDRNTVLRISWCLQNLQCKSSVSALAIYCINKRLSIHQFTVWNPSNPGCNTIRMKWHSWLFTSCKSETV